MSQASFVVPLADLERGPKTAKFPVSEEWLRRALADTDAEPFGGEGLLEVELMKNGADVLVRGSARVSVVVPCSRTLDPVVCHLAPEIFLMLAPATAAGAQTRPRRGRGKQAAPAQRSRKPKVTSDSTRGWDADPVLAPAEAARDTFEGEQITLDPFVREFILLDLPMFPLREDLRSGGFAATSAPPEADDREKPVDPRLLPLQELMQRMRQNKE